MGMKDGHVCDTINSLVALLLTELLTLLHFSNWFPACVTCVKCGGVSVRKMVKGGYFEELEEAGWSWIRDLEWP